MKSWSKSKMLTINLTANISEGQLNSICKFLINLLIFQIDLSVFNFFMNCVGSVLLYWIVSVLYYYIELCWFRTTILNCIGSVLLYWIVLVLYYYIELRWCCTTILNCISSVLLYWSQLTIWSTLLHRTIV